MPSTRKTWKTRTRRYGSGKHGGKYGKTYGSTTSSWRPTTTYSPTRFTNCKKTLQAKIGSYRTINQQFSGTGKVTAFSPAGANKWIRYVDQGAWVYKFNTPQFSKLWGSYWNNPSPSTAFRYLQRKYGSSIKGVTRGKGNCWLVAATPKCTARPFSNYNWK